MKKKVFISLVLMVFLFGCAGTQKAEKAKTPEEIFIIQSYRTLALSQISYDFLMKNFASLYKAGEVSDEKFIKGYNLAVEWYEAQVDALKAMIAFQKGEIGKDRAEIVLKLLDKALLAAEEYLKAQGAGQEKKPLIR